MREKKTFCYRGERERRGWGVRMPDKEIYKNDMEALFYGVKLLNFSGLSLVLKKETPRLRLLCLPPGGGPRIAPPPGGRRRSLSCGVCPVGENPGLDTHLL